MSRPESGAEPPPFPALERWLADNRRAVVLALLGAATAIRLVLCLDLAGGPLPRFHDIQPQSDGAFFHRWGQHLAQGDWLQPLPFHPMHPWMRNAAESALRLDPGLPERLGLARGAALDRAALEEQLWDRWMGGATFYQEPGYPYLVGLTYLVTGPDVWHVYAWQLALGVATVLLLHRVARRLFSETAALVTGLLAVLAPVPLLYDVALLRDGLVVFASVALVALMRWAPEGGRSRWLVLGVGFGASLLVKQSFVLFPLAMAVSWPLARRPPLRDALSAAALVAAGMALPLLPLILRNLAVGVPPLAMNGSAAGMLALYHSRSASPVDLRGGPEFGQVLAAAGGRLGPSLLAAARTHAGLGSFAGLELSKLAYAWHGYEAPNDVDVYLFRQGAPVLAALPVTMLLLVPLAGAALAARRTWRAWPLLAAIAASLPPLVLSAVLSRYRAPLLTLLLPLGGAGAVVLARWTAGRRWLALAATAALAAFYLTWAAGSPAGLSPADRAQRYAFRGIDALAAHEPRFAVLCLRESARLDPENPKIRARLGQALLVDGDAPAALREVERAARGFDSSALRELHARVLAAVGRGAEAVAEARAAVGADPRSPTAAALLDELLRATPAHAPEASP